jgi:hypothetical protein
MSITLGNVLRALAGLETGRSCRRCSESIPRTDAFGWSEAVCNPCRTEEGTR